MQEQLRVKVGADISSYRSAMSKVGSIASKVAKAVAVAAAGVGAATALIGAKFENQLLTTATIANATGKEFKALEDKARELGRTTAFTATQAAEGMYDLASAGMSVNQIVDSVGYAMKLAGATGSQMNQATHLLAATMKQFGLEAKESKRITDTFAAAITGSLLTMDKLTEGMKYAGTTGSALGWSIEETTGALAQFINLGLQGGMAGTNLRMSMVQLTKQTDKAKSALAQMGLTFKDVNPETHTFGEILKTIGERAITTKQAVDIFGTRSGLNMKRLAQAAKEGTADFEGFVESLVKAQEGAGRTTEMYDRMMTSFANNFKILLSALQELAISIFDTYKEEGKDILQLMTQYVNKTIDWVHANREVINSKIHEYTEGFKKLVEYTIPLVQELGTLIYWAAKGFEQVGKSIGIVSAIFSEWVTEAWDGLTKIYNKLLDIVNIELPETIDPGSSFGPGGGLEKYFKITDKTVYNYGKIENTLKSIKPIELIDVDRLEKDSNKAFQITEEARKRIEAGKKKQYTIDMNRLEDQMSVLEDFWTVSSEQEIKIKEFTEQQKKELTFEELKAEQELFKNALESMKRTDEGYFDFKRKILDNELEQYKLKYEDNAEIIAGIEASYVQKYKDLQIEKLKASENFFDGIRAWIEESKKNITTWGDVGYNIVKTFAESSKSAMSDLFFDAFTGELKSLGDYWDMIWKSMLRTFTDSLAQMIYQLAKSGIIGMLTGQGTAGFNLGSLLGVSGSVSSGTATVSPTSSLGSSLASYLGLSSTSSSATVSAQLSGLGIGNPGAYTGAAMTSQGGTGAAAGVTGAAALGYIAGGILAAPVLGPVVTKAIHDIFTSKTAPSGAEYVQAYLAGVPAGTYLFGTHSMPSQTWFDSDSNMASILSNWPSQYGMTVSPSSPLIDMVQNKEVGYNEIYDLISQYGTYTDPTAHQHGGYIDKVYKFPGVRAGMGDQGFVSARTGETIFSEEDSKKLFDILSSINTSSGKESHIHVHVGEEVIATVVAKQSRTHPGLIELFQRN